MSTVTHQYAVFQEGYDDKPLSAVYNTETAANEIWSAFTNDMRNRFGYAADDLIVKHRIITMSETDWERVRQMGE